MFPRHLALASLRGARRTSLLLTAAAALLPLVAAGPAAAKTAPTGGACAVTPTVKAFSAFGDLADYSLLPGGNFESGTSGWTLGGASVTTGNSTAYVGGRSDRRSLVVPAKASVVSPPFCVGLEHPTWRLFAKQRTGTWAVLLVKVRFTDAKGKVNEVTVDGLNGSDYLTWKPSKVLKLAQVMPLWAAGQSFTAQIVLDPEDAGGDWQVDDIYVDPYRRT